MSQVTIQGNAGGNGTFTIAAPNASTDYTLTLPAETGTMLTSASSITQNAGPAFSAARISSTQSISSGTWTKVQLNGETFDTANCFDSTTNYRFTPNVAGYYSITAALGLGGSSMTRCLLAIWKNGSEYFVGTDFSIQVARLNSGTLVYLNGTTDYIELYGYIIATSPLFDYCDNVNKLNGCSMQGVLVRAA